MSVAIPTIASLMEDMRYFITRRHPLIRDFSDLSMLSVLNEAYARLLVELYGVMSGVESDLNIFTAIGTALDARVQDRLPEGRLEGAKAVGSLTFRRDAYGPQVTIPLGTKAFAIGQNGEIATFETTEIGIIAAGDLSTVVSAAATTAGVGYNVPEHTVTTLTFPVTGVNSVDNIIPFSGGTPAETDEELRNRYIYAVLVPGTATTPLLEEHLTELAEVTEAKVYTEYGGDIQVIVDYSGGIGEDSAEIATTLLNNMAAGITSRGIIVATIVNGAPTCNIDMSRGGRIWIRPTVFISTQQTMSITYIDTFGLTKTATVIIPANTRTGVGIAATMESTDSRAVSVSSITYSGNKSFDISIGMGTYPYMYSLPRPITVTATIVIHLTDTPEVNLATKIHDSIEDYLGSFKIGDNLEYSSLYQYIFMDYAESQAGTGRLFSGIHHVDSCMVSGNSQSIDDSGQTITISEDQRITAGAVVVTVV